MTERNSTSGRIVWASDDDNSAILKLAHRCYQEGMITLYPDRSPVFNRIHQQLDPNSYHAMAREGDRVTGLLGIIHQELYLNDHPYNTAYFLDFKVDPAHRHGLTAWRLARACIEREVADGRRMGLATLLRGNRAVEVFTRGRAGFPASVNLGANVVWNILPLFKMRTDPGFTIASPDESDIPELVALYNRYYGSYRLAPRITEEQLRFYMHEIDGLDIGRFKVARRDGKIKAVLAAWDEEPYKRFMVIRRNMQIKLMNWFMRILGIALRMPAPVLKHRPLRQQTAVLYAHDDCADALGALLRNMNNDIRGKGYTLFQLFVHEHDPINQVLKGMIRIPVYSDIHLFTDTQELADEVKNAKGGVHLEFPMYV